MGVRADSGEKRDSHEGAPPPRAAGGQLERDSNEELRRPAGWSSERRRSLEAICGKGEKFVISSRSFPQAAGCYSQLTQYNGEAMYSPSRDNDSSNYVLGATQGDTNDPHDFRWSLVYANSGDTKESFSLCQSVQSASTTHPANAMWSCDLSENGELTLVNRKNFSVSCGCGPPDGTPQLLPGDSATPTLRSRAVVCGSVFGVGVLCLCCALSLKMVGGRKRLFRQPTMYARAGTVNDSL